MTHELTQENPKLNIPELMIHTESSLLNFAVTFSKNSHVTLNPVAPTVMVPTAAFVLGTSYNVPPVTPMLVLPST
jgi:hypothetical protein